MIFAAFALGACQRSAQTPQAQTPSEAPLAIAVGARAPEPPTKHAILALSSGSLARHTCAIRSDGKLRCWGDNRSAQLGRTIETDEAAKIDFATADLGNARPISVATGRYNTCVILENHALKCWGDNSFGTLGLGDADDRGLLAQDLGEQLPAVDLGRGRTARAVTIGVFRICAILDTGVVKCWGDNRTGTLGIGALEPRWIGDRSGQMGDALAPIDLGAPAKAIAAGSFHTCALLEDGRVKCWGQNFQGELGLSGPNRGHLPGQMGSLLPAVDLGLGRTARAIGAGGKMACALLDDASVKCWGEYEGGTQQTPVTLDLGAESRAQAIAVGEEHACALLEDQTVKCWGSNTGGMLGRGTSDPGKSGVGVVDLGGPVRAITAGAVHSCALLDRGNVKCWGNNDCGELGLGDREGRGGQTGQMGALLPSLRLW